MKIKRTCEICKKEFFVYPSALKGHACRYCSKKCHVLNQTGKNNPRWREPVKRICKLCGEEFHITPSRTKRGGGKYCSNECHAKARSKKVEQTCQACGKKFVVQSYIVEKGYGEFCSHRCSSIWNVKHQRTKDTDIEQIMEAELIKQKIPYLKQAPVEGIALVDFLLSNKVVIQCDGDFWHHSEWAERTGQKDRDANQNFILGFNGYTVYRFSGTEIRKSVKKCLAKCLQNSRRNQ